MTTPEHGPDLASQYSELRPRYDEFSRRVERLLRELLPAEGLDVVQIEARAKSVESFAEKAGREPGKYADPLAEMQDLAGVRVVAYYLSDVAQIDAVIEREFEVDTDNSWKRDERTDPDRFGYASDHYVVSCSEAREALPEWMPYEGMVAEIQVRTVLQHAWAAIDHKLAYKRSGDLPDELRRQLSRVSALLEVGDEQFEAARAASQRLDATYESRARAGDLSSPIDGASLRAYIAESGRARQLADIGVRVGFVLESGIEGSIPELRDASEAAGFEQVQDLDNFLVSAEAWAEQALKTLFEGQGEGSQEWRMPLAFLLAILVWLGSDIDLDRVREMTPSDDFFINGLRAARSAAR